MNDPLLPAYLESLRLNLLKREHLGPLSMPVTAMTAAQVAYVLARSRLSLQLRKRYRCWTPFMPSPEPKTSE